MNCIDCDGPVTVFSQGKPYERAHCHKCGAQRFKGLQISRKDWEQWVDFEAPELIGRPVIEQVALI